MISVNWIIIGITAVVSFLAFSNPQLKSKMLFWPTEIKGRNEWWRFLTHGLIHADMTHLAFNMITLYFFGDNVINGFNHFFGANIGSAVYVVFYLLALIASSIWSYVKHNENPGYRALGASGAVSAVLFAAILFNPMMKLMIFPLPIPLPALLFGPLYLVYCIWQGKRGRDNIGHDAHFWGAVFGLVFPIIMKPSILQHFIKSLPI